MICETEEDRQIFAHVAAMFGQRLEAVHPSDKACLLSYIAENIIDGIEPRPEGEDPETTKFFELVDSVQPLSIAGTIELAIAVLQELQAEIRNLASAIASPCQN